MRPESVQASEVATKAMSCQVDFAEPDLLPPALKTLNVLILYLFNVYFIVNH